MKHRSAKWHLGCAAFAAMFFAAAGCSGEVDRVRARCLLDNDSMILPVKFEKAYPGGDFTYFLAESSLAELKSQIDGYDFGTASVDAAVYEDVLVLEKTDAEGALHYYYVHRDGGSYIFTAPIGWIDGVRCLVPLHLLDYGGEYSGYEGEPCRARAPLSAFREFYEKTGRFTLTEEDGALDLSWQGAAASMRLTLTYGKDGVVTFSAAEVS